jgi:DNA-binding NarL/FixJ family response regulator
MKRVDGEPSVYVVERNPLAAQTLQESLIFRNISFLDASGLPGSVPADEDAVVILDASTFGVGIQKSVSLLRVRSSKAHMVIIGECMSDKLICQLLDSGAHGFLEYRELGKLAVAIRAVAAGHFWIKPRILEEYVRQKSKPGRLGTSPFLFTPREMAVLSLLKAQLSNKEIGNELRLTERTVKFHLANISRKLGVHGRRMVVDAVSLSGFQIPNPVLPERTVAKGAGR